MVGYHSSATVPGAVALLREQLQDECGSRIYPVHRLDTATSGILVFAKSAATAGELVAAFRERRVSKYYVALSDRKPSRKQGSVIGDMERSRRGSWMLARSTHNAAITRFISLGVPNKPGLRAFLLKPETGKTHQLRVALKSLGSPALGDLRYADAQAASQHQRMYLHCAALRLPLGGSELRVICPPQDGDEFLSFEFQQLFRNWFPPKLEESEELWFADSKLLRSGSA